MMNCIENPQTETRSSHCMHNKKHISEISEYAKVVSVISDDDNDAAFSSHLFSRNN
jgi:hypothetical protein